MSCPRCFEGAALQVALSYVLDPRLMSTLCAVSVAFNDASYRLESWSGLVVDTPVESKPLGLKACNCHWALWKFAKAIYVRPWMFASCTFLIGSRYKPWKWLFPNVPRPFVSIHPARVVLAVALVGSPWRHCNGHWISVGSPVSPVDIRMRLGKADCIPRGFVIGMSDTCDPREIATLLCGDGEARWGLAERGPPPMQLVHLNFYNGSFHQGLVKMRWSSRATKEPSPRSFATATSSRSARRPSDCASASGAIPSRPHWPPRCAATTSTIRYLLVPIWTGMDR